MRLKNILEQHHLSSMADNNSVIFLGFADNKIPLFKEIPSKEWILFGEDNAFPDHLLKLYNKSSVHGAIVNNKVKYILGSGIDVTAPQLAKINRNGESLNKILEKSSKDIELFGGFYWQVIYNAVGKIGEIIHTPFQEIRKAKDGKGWWHCKQWDWKSNKKTEPSHIASFDITQPVGVQLFSYREYRPGASEYPLPGYFSALNDIETDTEISIYNLSVMKNGQFSGKLISFFDGVPTEEEKKKLEKHWNDKFNGSGNAGKTMLAFNRDTAKPPQVDDLSATELDKLFDQLSKSTQAKIFAGHEITTPVLFGLMDSGNSLGGDGSTLEKGYAIFRNTYANAKQQAIEEILALFLPLMGLPVQKIIPVSPLGAMAGVTEQTMTNDSVKNMTGRQYQHMDRIIKKFKKGTLDKKAAALMLKSSFGFSDEDIEVLLTKDEQFDSAYNEEEVADMFAACGEAAENFAVVKSKPFKFEEERMEFVDVKGIDSSIIDLMRKDKRITADVIASILDVDKSYITARIKQLQERGAITSIQTLIGVDTIIEHAVNTEVLDTVEKAETVDIFIKYEYRARPGLKPVIETTRPFCKKLIELNRVYTRSDIESISQRVGYSVWDRRGGFWGSDPQCRHEWRKLIVIKKRK